ncbi:MAG: hypothetical protein V4506_08005 [Bacteroidota bacterium]
MKKEDVPQDPSALLGVTRDVCYVKDKDGKYTTDLSIGWEVKKQALDNAWDDIHERVKDAAEQVKRGEISPVFYFMELKLMDVTLLAGYTGFWKWTVKRHFKPKVFHQLNEKKIAIYAKAFDISVEELKKFKG